ncbi:hypothetical protein H1R20_g9092, partial [Candolleomyces eurysporus]
MSSPSSSPLQDVISQSECNGSFDSLPSAVNGDPTLSHRGATRIDASGGMRGGTDGVYNVAGNPGRDAIVGRGNEESTVAPISTTQVGDNATAESSNTESETTVSRDSMSGVSLVPVQQKQLVSIPQATAQVPLRPISYYNRRVYVPQVRATNTPATPRALNPSFAVFGSNLGESLAEALANDHSVPSTFVKERYPSLFIPATAFQLPDGDETDYKCYSVEDFERLAKEDPRRFLRITVPYLAIADGLGNVNSYMLFKAWAADFEVHNPRYQAAAPEHNAFKRRDRGWNWVKQSPEKVNEWGRVCSLVNHEFRKRYPLRQLFKKDMQALILDTLTRPKQDEDLEMKAVRLYWINIHNYVIPRDLKRSHPKPNRNPKNGSKRRSAKSV